jgi:hypothetical protein
MSNISEKFIEDMVDKVIARLSDKLDDLDISLDYIGALLSGQATTDVAVRQKGLGRLATDKAPQVRIPEKE